MAEEMNRILPIIVLILAALVAVGFVSFVEWADCKAEGKDWSITRGCYD